MLSQPIRFQNFKSYEGGRNEAGQRHGTGKAKFPNGDSYEGNYFEGGRQGFGVYRFTNGARYKGHYDQNKKHGQGTMHYPDGSVYEGNWCRDERDGQGKYTYINGDIYQGLWEKNMKNGQGTYTFAASEISYSGMWNNDVMHGFGEINYGKYCYVGYMNNGKLDGRGKMVFNNGYLMNGYYKTTANSEEEKEKQTWIVTDLQI